jgi:rfaE bifunctional protein nucleotidyltransferase chain/domain
MISQMTRKIEDKIKTIQEIEEISRALKAEGKTLVTTNGSFDILHSAHVSLLEKARGEGDVLIVLINSDSSIKRNKGEKRPIVPEQERARVIASQEAVDFVVVFDEDKPSAYLEKIKAQVHAKGAEVSGETRKLISQWGGKYKAVGIEPGLSTTNIINKVLQSYTS